MRKAKTRLSKRSRNKKGQYQRSPLKVFTPLIVMIITIVMGGLVSTTKKQELISPYVSTYTVEAKETETEQIKSLEPEWKTGKITAYSCNGIEDQYHLDMNCPSIKVYGEPRTANGTAPIIDQTMACDPANMGRTFEIEGVGIRTCTDTGGAIKGAGRFDLYVKDIKTAYTINREVKYRLIEN